MTLPLFLGLIYLVSEALLALLRRSREDGNTNPRDRNSLRLLWIVIGFSIWAGIDFAQRWPAAVLPSRSTSTEAGLLVYIAGLALRWWSIIQLGRFFTVNVAIAKDHRLIEAGPYRFVRHPSYTGALLAFAGFGLSLGNWVALLVMMLPIFAAFAYRMQVEEQALNEALGAQYSAYTRRTKRLVPFLY